jgi:hypothetical protein
VPGFGKHDDYLPSSRQRYNDSLTIKRDLVMPFLNCMDLDERKQIKRN